MSAHTTNVEEVFSRFKEGVQKDAASSDKETLDKTRDRIISGFMFGIKSEENFPQIGATRDPFEKLQQVFTEYGFKINRLSYDEQSSAVDNMIDELESINLEALPHLQRWIKHIKTANEAFKASVTDYLDQSVKSSSTDSATQIAPELVTSLENLYTFLFAHATVTNCEPLIEAYSKVAALVESFR